MMGLKPENIKNAGEMCLKGRSPKKIHSFILPLFTDLLLGGSTKFTIVKKMIHNHSLHEA